jgi:hypothetical protein
MQYDDELIEMQIIGDCIFRNPVRNPTYRSRDAHKMRIGTITKQQHFSASLFEISRSQTAKLHGARLPFSIGSVSLMWNMKHSTFDSNRRMKKLFNIGMIRRDLCATDRMFGDFISVHLTHVHLPNEWSFN